MDNAAIPEVAPSTVSKTFEDAGAVLLEAEITVPEVSGFKRAKRVNKFYGEVSFRLLQYAQGSLFKHAKRRFRDVLPGGFVPYKLVANYEVVRNSAGALTLCRDVSEFVPGREAVTARYVENWDIASGSPIFPALSRKRLKAFVEELQSQAGRREMAGEAFFRDVKRNVKKHFNIGNCLLREDGIDVYYPPSSLAPMDRGFLKLGVEGSFKFE